MSDAIAILGFLFMKVPEKLSCAKGGDVNDDGAIDIADPINLLTYLFMDGAPPKEPFAACQADPSSDSLTCDSFPPCQVSPPRPDLSVKTIAMSPAIPTTKTRITFHATVVNGGKKDSPACKLGIALGSATPLKLDLPAVPAGGETVVSYTTPTPVPAGSYTIEVTADVNHAVAESDETNNARTFKFKVGS